MIPAVIASFPDLGSGVARLPRKLQQCRRRTPPGLGALPAPQSAGEIMHEGRRRMLHRCQIDVARRLASRALNLQPGEAAVDSLVDGGRWVDWLAVTPHP